MLMPRTWTSYRSNSERSSSYAGIWSVQTGVKASGKNARTTFFLPRKSESFTSVSKCDFNVKSGASSPTFGALTSFAIEILLVDFRSPTKKISRTLYYGLTVLCVRPEVIPAGGICTIDKPARGAREHRIAHGGIPGPVAGLRRISKPHMVINRCKLCPQVFITNDDLACGDTLNGRQDDVDATRLVLEKIEMHSYRDFDAQFSERFATVRNQPGPETRIDQGLGTRKHERFRLQLSRNQLEPCIQSPKFGGSEAPFLRERFGFLFCGSGHLVQLLKRSIVLRNKEQAFPHHARCQNY